MVRQQTVLECGQRVRLNGRGYTIPDGTTGAIEQIGREDSREFTVFVKWDRPLGRNPNMKTWVPPYALVPE